MQPDLPHLLVIVLATAVGSAMNSIAGGGTLLTFPALVALGVPGIVANATSTVALVPGSVAAFLGYREALSGAREWAVRFAIPSVIGGVAGALLLLVTPADRFDALVPWLVLGATALFIVQRPTMRFLRSRRPTANNDDGGDPATLTSPVFLFVFQLLIGVYGGYFGAGMGILMLAGLGFLGFTNIHRMNGLKTLGATCANLMAAATFALSHLVNWPVAGAMAIGAIVGGYGGSRLAQRVSQDAVRKTIILIGLASGLWMLIRELR